MWRSSTGSTREPRPQCTLIQPVPISSRGCDEYGRAAALDDVLGRPHRGGRVAPALPLRPWLLDAGPSLRADGRGRMTHLASPSTPAGKAHIGLTTTVH